MMVHEKRCPLFNFLDAFFANLFNGQLKFTQMLDVRRLAFPHDP